MTVTLEVIEGPAEARDADGWDHFAYEVELTFSAPNQGEPRRMRTPWRQGTALLDDPAACDVLESLFLDAFTYDQVDTFEEWAEEYGYDTDSRKAEAIFRKVGVQTRKLHKLLGSLYPFNGGDAEELARHFTASAQVAS